MEPACDRERRAVLLAAGLALGGAAPAAAAGGIEGLWLASVGSEDNRARVGLEVGRAADGALQAFFTIDQLNFFRVSLPPLEPAGEGRWTIRKFEIEIALAGERLKVSGLVDDPVEMQRVTALPQRRPPLATLPLPQLAWRVGLGGPIYAPPAVYEDRPTSATPTA